MQATPEIERHISANMSINKKDIIIGNLLGGIAWGVGTVIGAGVIVGILFYILNLVGAFTGLNQFFGQFNQNLPAGRQDLPKIEKPYK